MPGRGHGQGTLTTGGDDFDVSGERGHDHGQEAMLRVRGALARAVTSIEGGPGEGQCEPGSGSPGPAIQNRIDENEALTS